MKEQIERLVELYTAYMNSTEENEAAAQNAYTAAAQELHKKLGYTEAQKIIMTAIAQYNS